MVGSVPGVVTATFTGKAALVLRRKGTPARTIHSLIYSVIVATDEEIEAAGKKMRRRGRKPQARRFRPHGCRGGDRGHVPGDVADEETAVRAQSAERRSTRASDRPRRGLDGRRGHGARSHEFRQTDPGAGRSWTTAADQGRRRVHQGCARHHADRNPSSGGGERDHPARHHGTPGRADRLRSVRHFVWKMRKMDVTPEQACVAAR